MSLAHAEVQALREPSCLRGLQYRLLYEGTFAPEPWVAQLQRVCAGRLVYAQERWGARVVHRLIYQFRFELRIAERPASVTLLHRVCASEAQRAADRSWLCVQLQAALHAQPARAHRVAGC